jgi:peptidoglycan/xylan/chitin deacetylase (PgdA/CDA1 family)
MSAHRDEVPVSAPLWRTVFGALSPAGARARLTILILHRVREARDEIFPNEMHAAAFRERMRWVRHWFNVMPLEDAVLRLDRGALPARALAITFDDGYADNATVALPILREYGLHATFFVATAFLDGGMMWNDTVIESVRRAPGPSLDLTAFGIGPCAIATPEQRKAAIGRFLASVKYLPQPERQARVDELVASSGAPLRTDLMMTSEQVRELARAGMGIGGHTATHPILARLDAAAALREIANGRELLQGLVRQPIRLFAYPNGKPDTDYGRAHVRMVKDLGFAAAVSTASGVARMGDSLYELPRFTPWGGTDLRWGVHLARNLRNEAARAAA